MPGRHRQDGRGTWPDQDIGQKRGHHPQFDAPQDGVQVLGPRELGVGAIIDVNGDSVPDLLIPDERRPALRVVTFASGVFRELARLPHEIPVVTGLVASDVVYGLADGILVSDLFTP